MFVSKIDYRTIIAFTHDFVAVGVAWWIAYLFRFNFDIPSSVSVVLISTLPWIVLTQTSFFMVRLVSRCLALRKFAGC